MCNYSQYLVEQGIEKKELDILEELEASHFSDKRIMKLLRIDAKHLEVLRNKLQKRLAAMADD